MVGVATVSTDIVADHEVCIVKILHDDGLEVAAVSLVVVNTNMLQPADILARPYVKVLEVYFAVGVFYSLFPEHVFCIIGRDEAEGEHNAFATCRIAVAVVGYRKDGILSLKVVKTATASPAVET